MIGHQDAFYSGEILDWIEEVSLYVRKDLILLDAIEDLGSFRIICWWYASVEIVKPERQRVADQGIWLGAEELVDDLHKSSRRQNTMEWAQRPSDKLMRGYFEDFLETVSNERGGYRGVLIVTR